MIDTHCHIYLEQFEEDVTEVLDRAWDAGVGQILMPAIDFGSFSRMDRLAHDRMVLSRMAGIHPTAINEGSSTTEDKLAEYCSRAEVVAVGETGLDYYWDDRFMREQQESLHLHCRVAKATGKPVVLHNRESTEDLLRIISEEQDGRLAGVWHCFNGTEEEGKQAIDLGLMLGIGGVVTFKNAGVDKTVGALPLEHMVLETDAPYLSPEPKRGERNEPGFIRYTADKLKALFRISFEEIDRITTANAERLFRLQE